MRYTLRLLLLLLLAGCARQPALSPLSPGDVILAFGDSLTWGTGVSASMSYPAVLEELTGLEVVRSGVPGELSRDGLKRLDTVLREVEPDLVILCHGGNDVLRRLNPAQTEANLKAMIRLVRDHGSEVAVLAVPKFGLFPEPWDYYERIQEEMQVPVEYDVLADLESDSAMKSDRVHFNSAGYRKMAEATRELLRDAGAL
ncbi:MAG: arylesterase [Pseudomonadales bacterium]|nr:arylesterase [Pseudomonadales bacterium]